MTTRSTSSIASGLDSAPGGGTSEILTVAGTGCVVLGGLVAAVTGPLELSKGSWLAAYLVLVCGVGTRAIGTVQAGPGESATSAGRDRAQLACWGLGNTAVIVGSLVAEPVVVDVGVPLLVIALATALLDPRGRQIGRLGRWTYRALLVALLIGAPIGAVLAHLRSGT